MSNRVKVNFAPGCFDTFDGTQEELDALISEIEAMADNGDFLSMEVVAVGADSEIDADVAEYYQSLADADRQLLH